MAGVSTYKPYDWQTKEAEERATEYLARKSKEREGWIKALKAGIVICLFLLLILGFIVGVLSVWR